MQQATVVKWTRLALAWEDALRDNPALTVSAYCASTAGINRTTLDHAIHWRNRNCVQLADTSKLEAAIIALRERKASLDRFMDKALRGLHVLDRNRNEVIVDPSLAGIAALAQSILAVDTRILELEGLYKQVLNIKLEGRVEHRHYDLTKLSTDQLIDLRSILNHAATSVIHGRN